VDRLESRNGDAEDFQEFQGEVWIGDSYQRALLRTELELREQTIEESKTELLYRRAITPFWNLEVGGRYDHGDNEHREWFALGVSGLAPYWFELSATAYIGPEGHSAATIEAEYDLYLTQRLILQPKAELDFYGDSDLEAGHGKGLSKSLLGFRLRYDYDRQFSPYVGYERVHRHGETTTVFEPLGQHREGQWIAGFRFWF
jgi:copper resistance protein B